MEKKDVLYLIGSILIVAILALVIKPLITQGTLPVLAAPFTDPEAESQNSIATSPVYYPSPVPTTVPPSEPWSGEVKVLHFLDEIPAAAVNETEMVSITATPTPRIYVGNSTVASAYPVVPAHKPSIPEGAIHKPTMENRGQLNTSSIFEQTYDLRYNSLGFLVDVVKPPFVIAYTTTPTTSDPFFLNNPYYCFMTITVRDPETMEIITEEGYGRVYSTDTEKVITLYRSGTYHVTLYGNMVKVKIMVEAGS